ncbi:complement C1q tumor necrosis factor-related protein 2-like [Mercenaria mercenaria]|uniref:complement C1q tumor necrosis factor-related protein 2-like n=1 Tax=Mercenaria mercenaria TaxID=6596 RepID=UPI00234F2F83|nr:complement C1q tumor necrosis factor-related protein 2-like [Mercenaria mercenaria]
MEFSEKNCDTTDSNEPILYENTDANSVNVALIESKKMEEIDKDEEHYEPLRLDSKPRHKGTLCNLQEDALKRLKSVIYIVSALIFVLYIAVIVLIISVVMTNSRAIASAFSVDKPLNHSSFNGTSKVIFAHMIYQHGIDFNSSTGTFTCSIPGTYHFSVTLVKKRASSGVFYCGLYKNVSYIITIGDPTDDDTNLRGAATSQSTLIHLDKGDTVYLGSCNEQPSSYMEPFSSFTGFLLYSDN